MGVQTSMIEIQTSNGAMKAQLAKPEGAGPFPAVLVIMEAFGLNGHIKDVAQRIAAEGYVTLAPDIFHRSGELCTAGYDDLPAALKLMGALTDEGIVTDVRSAIQTLTQDSSVRADRIGITGFCMGGRVSYLAASALPDKIAAAAPFYGGGIPIDRTANLKAPVLAFFGDEDPFIPMDHVHALEAEAKRYGKNVEVVVYPKAPHGFFCNERDSYRPEAAKDSWEKLKAFFAKHLKA
ncbi:MAG TPA: dienelactone hydrolase family protein [Candidatus Binatia bacterium]|jgi:carboxymethylenebutenolidase|nr:dienelactone hydrolase family protein [Candidatus Binatia bacterium]